MGKSRRSSEWENHMIVQLCQLVSITSLQLTGYPLMFSLLLSESVTKLYNRFIFMGGMLMICSLIVIRITINSSTPRHLKFVRWCICWCVYVSCWCMLMCSLLFDNPSLRLIYCNLFTQTLHRWHTLFDVLVLQIVIFPYTYTIETSYVASSRVT